MRYSYEQWEQSQYLRVDRIKGEFGSYKRYQCCECDSRFWEEPEAIETQTETYWEPAEYEVFCPSCGMPETIEDRDYPEPYKLINRYTKETE